MKNYAGIDPGKNGAIVLIKSDNTIIAEKTPLLGKEYNILEFKNIIKKLKDDYPDIHFIVEHVHAIFGVAAGATFEFGYGCGLIEGILVSLGISYTKVQPKEWQKLAFKGTAEIRKPDKVNKNGKTVIGRLDTKPMALLSAQRLFPDVNLKATDRSTKAHEGIVDALLLAYYGKTTNL